MNRLKNTSNLNLGNEDNLKYWAQQQASMGEKAFVAKYGKEVNRAVTSYRQSNVRNTTNNTTTNNNYYGNIGLNRGSSYLDALTDTGMNFAGA